MNYNQFTIKSQEAIQKAGEIANAFQNQSVENLHLLKGILSVDENVVPYLLKKNNVSVEKVLSATEQKLYALPKVSGGEQFLSNDTTRALQKATDYSKAMKDEFVSLEHLLLGILSVNDQASQILKDQGVTENDLKTAIRQLRQGSTVKSQTAEET